MKTIATLKLLSLFFIFNQLPAQNIDAYKKVKNETNSTFLINYANKIQQKNNQNYLKAIELANKNGWYKKVIEDGKIIELVGVTKNNQPIYYETNNINAAITTGTDHLWLDGGLGLNLTGEGINVGEWDGGIVLSTHQEFNNNGICRIIIEDPGSNAAHHATHVAGTIIGHGATSQSKGMAPNATLKSYDWSDDTFEMSGAANDGMLVSNHSYGNATGWVSVFGAWNWNGDESISIDEDYKFGFYNEKCEVVDNIAFNSPYYLMVKSAGNDRGNGPENGDHPVDGGESGYDCIPPVGNAKNNLTVGAVKDLTQEFEYPTQIQMTTFSSWGPTDDGRIKPDICGNGYELYSSYALDNQSYGSMSGTSMASPNITGSIVLLQELYNNLHNCFAKSATLKAIVIHTAYESGPHDGPDYMFGWGVMNAKKASEVIMSKDSASYIIEDTLFENQQYELEINATGLESLTATLVWTDPAATPLEPQLDPTNSMLINDLDMVVSKDATNYYPWKLDLYNPDSPATKGDNDVDNVEKIEIIEAESGKYYITINHEGLLENGHQAFSLVITGIIDNYAILSDVNVEQIYDDSVRVSAQVIYDSGFPIIEKGFVLNTTGNPTINDTKTISTDESYCEIIRNLESSTQYFIKPYAINEAGIAYGGKKTFVSKCNPQAGVIPIEEFSNGLPECWNIESENQASLTFENPNSFEISSPSAHNGFALFDYQVQHNNSSLITRAYDLSEVNFINVSFDHKIINTLNQIEQRFLYSTNYGENWHLINSWKSTQNQTKHFEENLSYELQGANNVMFKFEYNYDWFCKWGIDDFEINLEFGDSFPLNLTVLNSKNRVPVDSVDIEIYSSNIVTDSGGNASINLPNGWHKYTLHKDGFYLLSDSVLIENNSLSKTIYLSEILYDVIFTVINSTTNDIIEGAIIEIADSTLMTNDSGNATFKLPSDNYDYAIRLYGYEDYIDNLSVNDENLSIIRELVQITKNASIIVLDSSSNPLSNSQIQILNETRWTDESGHLNINLPYGEYPYTASKNGYYNQMNILYVNDTLWSSTSLLEHVKYNAVFHVEIDGQGVQGVQIHIGNSIISTDQEGIATIQLINGLYPFSLFFNGYQVYEDIFIINCSNITKNISLTNILENKRNGIKVFPNPANDVLHINSKNLQEIKIYNMHGKMVYYTSSNICTKIDVSSFASGFYVFLFKLKDKVITKKVLISH
jgi:hypothetical protein